MPFDMEKLEWPGYLMVKNFWRCFYSFCQNSRMWQTDTHTHTHTHTQTDTAWRYGTHSIARQKCMLVWVFSQFSCI